MEKLTRFIGNVLREFSSLIFTGAVIVFFWQFPGYEPTDGMQAMFIASLLLWFYMFLQGGSLAFGGMGSSVSLITDVVFSAAPLGPIGFALLEKAQGDLALSDFQGYVAYMAIVAVMYDLLVNGGLMARINRYMNEFHGTR